VGQHNGIVVDIHDPCFRCRSLGDLVGVAGGGQAGADVEELPDAKVGHQVVHRAGQERAVSPGDFPDDGRGLEHVVAGGAVGGVVVLAAEPVVPDPGRVRD
jgi:hypothetical protein